MMIYNTFFTYSLQAGHKLSSWDTRISKHKINLITENNLLVSSSNDACNVQLNTFRAQYKYYVTDRLNRYKLNI